MSDFLEGELEHLAGEMSFTEGPVWIAEASALLFTDIPGNAIMRWKEDEGLSVWCGNAHFAIGLTRDRTGRVIACEHSTRTLSALSLSPDGALAGREVLARAHDGRVLNSTNDVICTRDGTILFTDPPFGVRNLEGALHGYQQAQELPGSWVFAVGPDADQPRVLCPDIYRPNGLCLSPDETILYVSDSSERHHKIVALDVGPDWALSNLRDLAVMPVGVPDGMRVDADGNVWAAGGDGVYVFAPDGAQIGHVPVPEMVTNVEWGGADLSQLFITATRSLYRVRTRTRSGRAW